MDAIRVWGSTEAERLRPYPCDEYIDYRAARCFRAVDVDAPQAVTFRWLCQLRVAPYSYDLLDNAGRQSPQQLVDGLNDLEIGQRFMTMFKLVAFQPGHSITLVSGGTGGILGNVAVTYLVSPRATLHSRIVAKLRWDVPAAHSMIGRFLRLESAAMLGDLVMMRRQLLNLKRLAEAQA